jgi:hypothetical protein
LFVCLFSAAVKIPILLLCMEIFFHVQIESRGDISFLCKPNLIENVSLQSNLSWRFSSAIKSHGDKNSFLCNQISWR